MADQGVVEGAPLTAAWMSAKTRAARTFSQLLEAAQHLERSLAASVDMPPGGSAVSVRQAGYCAGAWARCWQVGQHNGSSLRAASSIWRIRALCVLFAWHIRPVQAGPEQQLHLLPRAKQQAAGQQESPGQVRAQHLKG